MSSGERGSQTLKEALGAGFTAGSRAHGHFCFRPPARLQPARCPDWATGPTGQLFAMVTVDEDEACHPSTSFWHINSISRWRSVVHQVLVLSNSPPDGNQVFVEVVRHCLSCTRSVYSQQCKR
jgi:hypothetical protein